MLINAGIRQIVYLDGYPDHLSLAMLKEAGIECRHFVPTVSPANPELVL